MLEGLREEVPKEPHVGSEVRHCETGGGERERGERYSGDKLGATGEEGREEENSCGRLANLIHLRQKHEHIISCDSSL